MVPRKWHIWFLWLWLSTLPVSAVGIPFYAVYCACLKETTLAFFRIEDPCSATHGLGAVQAASCCAPKTTDCRASALPSAPSCCSGGDPDHACTKTTVVVAQLDASFLVDALSLPTFFDCIAAALPDVLLPTLYEPVLACREEPLPAPPRPPPLSGRDICLRHQLFLC